jgi:hypothetical protein
MHEPRAEIILVNAKPWRAQPVGLAPCDIVVGGGKILRIGHGLTADRAMAREVQIVDCYGCTVLPGFVDAHLHFHAFVDSLLSVDLRPEAGIRSIPHIQAAVRSKAAIMPPGQWVKGRGYDEFLLAERRHPTRWDLDAAAPEHPVRLTHRSLHARVMNSAALKLAGIGAGTPDPPAGLIERDLDGEPTGVLYEMGKELANRVPRWDAEMFESGVRQAARELAACGITEFVDASATNDRFQRQRFAAYRDKGLLPQRMTIMLGAAALQELGRRDSSPGDSDLPPVWGIKLVLDRTTGEIQPDAEALAATIREAHRMGWPVAVHAVELETVDAALTAFEAVLPAGQRNGPGHRIEHASICPPHLARRMATLGIKVATQPAFIYHSGDRYLAFVPPEQQPHLYPLATWLHHGVQVEGSSDCPVIYPSVLQGIYAAIARQSREGRLVGPEQRVSLEAAIAMYTRRTLAPGVPADLVLVSEDLTRVSAESLRDTEVRLTMIAGKIVWTGR